MARRSWQLAGWAIAAAVTPATAHAQDGNFGAGSILTNRVCQNGVGDCVLGPRIFTQYAGGLGQGLSSSATNENGLGASGYTEVTFGEGYLPTIKVLSQSGPTTRTGAAAAAFRTFVYSGAATINLALSASIHYISSGDDGIPGEEVGLGGMNVNLAILPTSALPTFGSTGAEIINSSGIGYGGCEAGEIAGTYRGSGGTSGDVRTTVTLTTTCTGGAITLHTGDAFVVYAGLQGISNRGGSLDATHTFTVAYDPINTVFADTGQSVGSAFFQQNIAAVPEPASWAMMIGGFGLVGGAVRRRRAAPVLVV